MHAHHPCGNIFWNSDDDEWNLLGDDRVLGGYETKDQAIEAAKTVDGMNRVLAWTKGCSNFRAVWC